MTREEIITTLTEAGGGFWDNNDENCLYFKRDAKWKIINFHPTCFHAFPPEPAMLGEREVDRITAHDIIRQTTCGRVWYDFRDNQFHYRSPYRDDYYLKLVIATLEERLTLQEEL